MTSDYVLYDQLQTRMPTGMPNMGSTCWLNAILQALLSCSSLNATVTRTDLTFNNFGTTYAKLVDGTATTPHDVYRALVHFVGTQRPHGPPLGNSQECAHEALTYIVQAFQHAKTERLFRIKYDKHVQCKECDGAIVSNASDIQYNIMFYSNVPLNTMDKFVDYIVLHAEPLKTFTCPKGHKLVDTLRTEALRLVREILIITFSKFYVKENIWFPQALSIPGGRGALRYKLVARVEHLGAANSTTSSAGSSGHYTADVLRNGVWYHADDTGITQTIEPKQTTNTFILIYHMVQ